MSEVGIAIEWAHIGPAKFNRIVEALMHRLYDASAEVQVVDGRGGDDGIDILVKQDLHVTIYQLKYFPDGFPGSLKGRRTQIKRSFTRALTHAPHTWVLVVPCNLTRPEMAFLERLDTSGSVEVQHLTQAKLDAHLSRFPSLVDVIARDDVVLENAKILRQESALLMDPSDLSRRVSALGRVVDGRDPNWTFDFARQGPLVTHTLRALHPRAAEVSPVVLGIQVSPTHEDMATKLRTALGFGITEPVILPPEAVTRLEVKGPDWLAAKHEHVTVELHPMPSPPKPNARVEIRLIEADGQPRCSHEGTLIDTSAGSRGLTLRARFHGATNLTLRLPHDTSKSVTVEIEGDISGLGPTQSLLAAELASAVMSGHGFELSIDGHHLGTFEAAEFVGSAAQEQLQALDEVRGLAADLEAVQRHCGVHFAVPETLTVIEHIRLRAARLMLAGKCVAHPEWRSLPINLADVDDQLLRSVLSAGPSTYRCDIPNYAIRIGQRTLTLGRVVVFHTSATIRKADEILLALDAGRITNLASRIDPPDGEYLHMFMPDKITDLERPLVPSPLELPAWAL